MSAHSVLGPIQAAIYATLTTNALIDVAGNGDYQLFQTAVAAGVVADGVNLLVASGGTTFALIADSGPDFYVTTDLAQAEAARLYTARDGSLVVVPITSASINLGTVNVFDDVPELGGFPYVSFGEATENPWDTFGGTGSDATITLHIWSRYAGFKEAQSINDTLIGLLDNQTGIAVAGYGLVVLNVENSVQLRDPDGITRHIATRFRVMADAT